MHKLSIEPSGSENFTAVKFYRSVWTFFKVFLDDLKMMTFLVNPDFTYFLHLSGENRNLQCTISRGCSFTLEILSRIFIFLCVEASIKQAFGAKLEANHSSRFFLELAKHFFQFSNSPFSLQSPTTILHTGFKSVADRRDQHFDAPRALATIESNFWSWFFLQKMPRTNAFQTHKDLSQTTWLVYL